MSGIFDACREVSARDTAKDLGLQFGRSGRAYCPICGHDPPTLSFTNGLFHCFCCGAAGDAVRLAETVLGVAPLDAARWVNSQFDCGYDEQCASIKPEAQPRVLIAQWKRVRAAELEARRMEYLDTICWAERFLEDRAPTTWDEMAEEYKAILERRCYFDAIWDACTQRDFKPEFPFESEVIFVGAIRDVYTGREKHADDTRRMQRAGGFRQPIERTRAKRVRVPIERTRAPQG